MNQVHNEVAILTLDVVAKTIVFEVGCADILVSTVFTSRGLDVDVAFIFQLLQSCLNTSQINGCAAFTAGCPSILGAAAVWNGNVLLGSIIVELQLGIDRTLVDVGQNDIVSACSQVRTACRLQILQIKSSLWSNLNTGVSVAVGVTSRSIVIQGNLAAGLDVVRSLAAGEAVRNYLAAISILLDVFRTDLNVAADPGFQIISHMVRNACLAVEEVLENNVFLGLAVIHAGYPIINLGRNHCIRGQVFSLQNYGLDLAPIGNMAGIYQTVFLFETLQSIGIVKV